MTTEQRKFVDAFLETGSAREAVLKMFPDMTLKEAGQRGAYLYSIPVVKEEIRLAEQAARVVSTLTAKERREWVADLVRIDPRKALAEKPHLVNSVDVTRRILETGEVEERVRIKLPDKLRALEVDAKLDSVGGGDDDEAGLLLDGLAELMGVAALPEKGINMDPAPALPDKDDVDTLVSMDDAI